jgi:putative N6-adenine-specific DNA methylase
VSAPPPTAGTLSLFAATAPGLEALAAAELRALGIAARQERGGAAWEGDLTSLYAANLHLRTAGRVLVRIAAFPARTFHELERKAARVPWERFVSPGSAVHLRVTCRKSRLYHEGAVAERVLAAVETRAGPLGARAAARGAGDDEAEETDGAPHGDAAAEQIFVVRFLRDACTISADASGALLHRRGYRQAVAKAPLRETLAAAVLAACGWHPAAPLLDPLCGSGTLPIEAALIARRIPPGLAGGGPGPRAFAFERWPEHDPALWGRTVQAARERVLPHARGPIVGSDRDAGAVEAARANAERAGVAADIAFEQRPLSALEAPPGPGWLVTNPPYGLRVGEREGLRNLYAALGRTARERLAGWTVALLAADDRLPGHTGLPLEPVLSTTNGGIPVRLLAARVDGG